MWIKGALTQSPFFYGQFLERHLYKPPLYEHLYMGPLNCNPIEDINTLWNYSFLLAAYMHYMLQAWQLQQN